MSNNIYKHVSKYYTEVDWDLCASLIFEKAQDVEELLVQWMKQQGVEIEHSDIWYHPTVPVMVAFDQIGILCLQDTCGRDWTNEDAVDMAVDFIAAISDAYSLHWESDDGREFLFGDLDWLIIENNGRVIESRRTRKVPYHCEGICCCCRETLDLALPVISENDIAVEFVTSGTCYGWDKDKAGIQPPALLADIITDCNGGEHSELFRFMFNFNKRQTRIPTTRFKRSPRYKMSPRLQMVKYIASLFKDLNKAFGDVIKESKLRIRVFDSQLVVGYDDEHSNEIFVFTLQCAFRNTWEDVFKEVGDEIYGLGVQWAFSERHCEHMKCSFVEWLRKSQYDYLFNYCCNYSLCRVPVCLREWYYNGLGNRTGPVFVDIDAALNCD